MKKSILISALALVFTFNLALAQQDSAPVYGNWEGKFIVDNWKDKPIKAQVVGESETAYKVFVFVDDQKVELKGETKSGLTTIDGFVDLGRDQGGTYIVCGMIANGVWKGYFQNAKMDAGFEMKRVEDKSPTLGRKAPEGAVVLVADENASQQEREKVFQDNWQIPTRWTADGDGSIHMQGGNIVAKKEFGDAEIHVEFKTPYMPSSSGQGRGNSGFYVMGRYEIQVLDSFADKPADNLCGGIYQFGTPIAYASFPPNTWQTYDIIFHAPKFDSDGKKVKNAEITMKHNGILVHDNLSLPRCTPGGISGKEAPVGPILIQDHNDMPRFKNVWIKPLGN